MHELAGASAGRLAQAIGAREASAREVVEAHLRRIDAVNGAVNALVQVDARAGAGRRRCRRRRARARRAGRAAARRPVHGQGQHLRGRDRDGDRRPGAGGDGRRDRRHRRGADEGGGRDPARQDQLPRVRRRDRDRQRRLRAHEQPLRPRAHARRQQRRRGGGDRGADVAVRARHRLRRERPPARPLLRPRRAQADRRPDPDHRRARRRGPVRLPVGPAHPDRAARRTRPPTSRCCCAPSPARTAPTAASRPSRSATRRAVELRGLRLTVQVENGLAPPTPETAAAVEAAAAALTAAGCTRADEPHPARRPRAHDRGLALLRRRPGLRRAVAAAAPLGRASARGCSRSASATT